MIYYPSLSGPLEFKTVYVLITCLTTSGLKCLSGSSPVTESASQNGESVILRVGRSDFRRPDLVGLRSTSTTGSLWLPGATTNLLPAISAPLTMSGRLIFGSTFSVRSSSRIRLLIFEG